ncbi:MAG TPA: HD domain-containing protein [Candidatus Paceibacterota bacterium]|nr:HD domain-containing protein [Candidatus Paceibacterota bacterium]
MKIKLETPAAVSQITKTLTNQGFSAYIVGGSVRDLLLNRPPKDWDVTTNAKPEEIVSLFPKTFYENRFGTVTVVQEDVSDETLRNIEITPFRKEGKYSDFRHPDEVTFADSVNDDLARRDFTINALAYSPETDEFIDLFGGAQDLKEQAVRAVGDAQERCEEDPLRILRGIRLAAELGFMINPETQQAMCHVKHLLKHISLERIRDEFTKIIMSNDPMRGLLMAQNIGILPYFLPELEEGLNMKQNGDHVYDVLEHTLRVLQHSADKNWPLHVRLAALLHDIGKPRTRAWNKEKGDYTFYGHEVVGARMAKTIMERLKFSRETTDQVVKLVRNHMFFSDIDKITLSAVRRIIRNVGPGLVWDLMKVRACDRIGMGRPKENPYRLRKYEAMIEEALRQPTSVGMLKIDGKGIMDVIHETPGPRIGWILHALLEEVLDRPELNTLEYMEKRAKELAKLGDQELKALGEQGRDKKEEKEGQELAKIRKRHNVR